MNSVERCLFSVLLSFYSADYLYKINFSFKYCLPDSGLICVTSNVGEDQKDAGERILGPVRVLNVGRDSSVGIETRYGLDGPGVEYR